MKLVGLYSIRDIPRLRANHRAFAERNMMDYVELFCGNFYQKWALVYWLLDSEPHETFVFIDAFSYFVSPDFDLDCSDPVVIQELNGKVMDNFFVVRSCPESRKIFSEVGTMASQRFIDDLSFYFDVPDSAGIAKPYGARTIGGKYFNVDLHCTQQGRFPGIQDLPVGFEFSESWNEAGGALDAGEMLVATFAGQGWVAQCGSVAEVLCCHRCHLDQPTLSTGLEVVNPGCDRALLTLSCCEPGEPFPEYVSVSERNLRRYAKEANVTLYLYKGIPPEYAGLHSTWTKPYLALRHLVDHDYLSWVDGDVLLSRDFALPKGQDVVVYKDPGAWLFNAGFITFRRSEKTFDYLRAVIARCEALDDRSSLYVNGSDQTQFIEEFQAHFPDLLPRSNLVANIPILLQSIRQAGPGLWHFMGLNPASIRTVVMDYYDKYVIDSHLSNRPAAIKSKPAKSETARPILGTKEIESQTKPSIHGFARIADKAVGKMWLINLPRRADRLEKFKANHPDLADCINVLPAYDGQKLRLTPKIARLFAPNDFGWNKATMGCSLSHLELWQKLADEPAQYASYLILEDDTRLSPEWLGTLQEAFARNDVPADWDVLYLGGVLPHNETVFAQCKEQISGRVFRVVPNGWFGQKPPNRYFHFGAYAYLLSKNGARKILEFIRLQNGIWPQADYILSYVTPADYPVQTNHYFFEPFLAHCYQDMESGYSRSYEDKGQPGKIDSDIWKESSAFDEVEAKRLSSLSESYDIPGALTEARAQMQPLAHAATAKISLLHATRGRPDQALEAKRLWLRMARHPERVEHLFAVDDDDESAQPLRAHPHVVQEEQGFSVGAWNLAASRCTGDILVQLSDDWLPPEGWDDLIAGRLDIAREEVLWISDGHRQDDLMCMAILTRKYHARHGLFDPAFRNVFSDNDFTVRAQKACAVVDGRDVFIKHNHPFAESARELDATYQRGNQAAEYERARAIYEAKHSSASSGSANSIRTESHSVPAVPKAHHAATAKISLLHATRGRPTQAMEAKQLWLRMAHHPERIEHLFAVDDDDESAQPLRSHPHVVQKEQGFSVGAWNLAASRSTGEILMQMSDDWDPPAGWDDLVAGSLDIASERVLWINEDYSRKDIMCMAILTRKYYEKYGLFDPRFKNVYSDDDFTAKAKKRSAITYANNIVFKHKHFTTGDSPVDATYQRCNDHNEYHRAKILFDSIHNAADADGGDVFTEDNRASAETGLRMEAVNERGNRMPTPMADHQPTVVPKAHHADWSGRFREVISDPLCILIEKHSLAGLVSGNDVHLHTGLKVPLSGPLSYYSEFSQILTLNRGIHEPLEEFAFQQVIPWLPTKPSMLELGAYWAHYSMWLLANRPEASVCMVEPDQAGLMAGIHNFKTNGFEGEFINAFVQAGGFEVDRHMETKGLGHLDILHADIQGYELQMLQGARHALGRKQIDYVFVSTHSQELHEQVCHVLSGLGYRVEVEADFDSETTSMDGFVFATSPVVPPVFRNFKPLGRVAITNSKPDYVFEYLKEVRSCISPVIASSNLFLREVSGVIHVGANTGQERHIYNAHGLRVLWVEPLPEVFAALEANIRGIAGQTALNALLADVDGMEYDLNVANNGGESSSILELKQHRDIWPEVEYVSKVRCQSTTLPALLEKAGIQAGKYDTLVLDTQGSELLVLRGALSLLQGFKFIKVEVPDFESYKGCCRDSDVSAFMAEHDFEEVWRSSFAGRSGTGSYFDVVYKKRS